MDQTTADLDQSEEEILACTVSDEALEAAGSEMEEMAPTFFLPTGYFQCC